MSYSEKQLEIIQTDKSKVIVDSAAAAGKTRTLTGRVKYLIDDLGIAPNKIVVITFTNAAAGEMRERIGNVPNLHISTVHSYANYLLLSKGIDTSACILNEQFNRLFNLIKAHPECIQEVEYLLLDEGQDSTEDQFEFLLNMVKPKNWMIFADHRQSIYRWAGADPQYLLDLIEKKDVTKYYLNENYRNGSDILDYAKSIINLAGYEYRDYSVAKKEEIGKVVDVEYSPMAIAKAIEKYGDYKNWFVLTRTNDQIDQISFHLNQLKIPCTTFKRAELTNEQLYRIMDEDKVKVLTIHTAKGLEADNVVVIGAKFYNLEEKCISYVAATRARKLLVWARTPNKFRRANTSQNWET